MDLILEFAKEGNDHLRQLRYFSAIKLLNMKNYPIKFVRINGGLTYVRIIKLSAFVCILAHIFGCGYYSASRIYDFSTYTWVV